MSDVLRHVYEYRRLLARRELLGKAFDPASRGRLDALEKLFAANPVDRHRRRYERCEVSVKATVKAGGRVQLVEIVNVGGGGMCVAPAPWLRPGERAVIKIVDASGVEYHYPVQAQWVERTDSPLWACRLSARRCRWRPKNSTTWIDRITGGHKLTAGHGQRKA